MKLFSKASLLTFLFFLTVLSTFGQEVTADSKSGSRKTTYNHSNGMSNFNVEIRGKIELTDDDKDIKSMSADGYLEVTKTVFGSKRSLVITPQGSTLKREYYEGRTSVPFEPAGRKWMNEILPELVRTTTIGAESRIARFYKQGGTNAVLEEIALLESDYVKAHYANGLMAINIPVKDYNDVINRVSNTIESDYYLAEFLKNSMPKVLKNPEATETLYAVCSKIESDHYKTEVIKAAVHEQAGQPMSAESIRHILDAASKMESDHYKTEVFSILLKENNLSDAVLAEVINGSKTVESDYYRSVVLNKALAKPGLSTASYQKVLESVKDIDSDHYKTEVLTNLLKNKLTSQQIENLVEISSSIDSDHYTSVVFNEVLKQDMNDEAFKVLINRASNVESDYYAATILQSALKNQNLSSPKIISILNAAGNIKSDHYITQVLMDAASRVRVGDADMKAAYRASAKNIENETYYGRAVKAIE